MKMTKQEIELQMLPVVSSNIKQLGYDSENEIAYVQFSNGDLYGYANVPKTAFDSFINSDSKGKYIRGFIEKYGKGEKIV